MSKIILEQTYHSVRVDAQPTAHTYAEAVERDYVVIDGVGVDMRGAVGDFSVSGSDCYDGGWRFSRVGDVTTLHLVHTLEGDTLPAHKVDAFEAFPAYMFHPAAVLRPDGTPTPPVPQTITSSYNQQITVAFAKQQLVDGWSTRLLRLASGYNVSNNSVKWAHEVGNRADVFAKPNAEGVARYNNFRDHSRLLGFTKRVIERYGDSEYGDWDVPAKTKLTTPAAIEAFITKVEDEFTLSLYYWFHKHDFAGLESVYGARVLLFTGVGGLTSESIAGIPTKADWDDLLVQRDNILIED